MAGHVQDRWYKSVTGSDGKQTRVRSERYGSGLRYRARYVGPDGAEKSKSFPDKQKRQADLWLAEIEADMSRGQYIDRKAGRVTFQQYAEKWQATQTTDPNTRASVDSHLRLHAFPYLGNRPMDSFLPRHIRAWLSELEAKLPASSYRRVIFNSVSAVFTAAVDDEIVLKNPCGATSITIPQHASARVKPWHSDRVFAVREGLPERFRAMVDVGGGCGLRQGEIFGLHADALDFDEEWVHVDLQVKPVNGRLVFAPPKRGKERDVPLPMEVAARLKAHMEAFPPADVTLPWLRPDGRPVTKRLLFVYERGAALRRYDFNDYVWKPALVAGGVIPPPAKGQRHQSAREHGMHALRHFYASVLLDAGENVKALAEYLGHGDPAITLRVYTHLMPTSESRTRRAVDKLYEGNDSTGDGPQTAQE